MEKIKEFLSKVNYSIVGFAVFSIRLALFGSSIADAIALFAFAGLYAFNQWLKYNQIEKHNEQFKQDVQIEFQRAAEEINKLKSVMGSLNLGSTYSSLRKAPTNGQKSV